MKKIFLTKYDGSKQLYDRRKVLTSILRIGVKREQVLDILAKVEAKLYDGISTKELYRIVKDEIDWQGLSLPGRLYRLRESLAKMEPGYFEKFIKKILEREKYFCQWNVLVSGFCVGHQIDVIAKSSNGGLFFIEVKRHRNFHRDCGLGEAAELWARLEDLQKGYKSNKNKYNFTTAWLITNTKFSEHAKKYAFCKDLRLTGWRYNFENRASGYDEDGLEKRIERLGAREVDKMIRRVIKRGGDK